MSYTKKLLKITWFGIENNYAMIGIILLISCFLMPAFSILSMMNSSHNMDEYSAQSVIKVYGTILAYLEGFILPLGLFSYVHKRRSCDFYNSMPVRRSQYFLGYALTGIAVFMVSFGWMFAVHFVILGFHNIFPCFLQPIAMFLVIYCSMILAVCFSGSIMSALVTFVLRNCIYVSIVLLPLVIAGVDMNSYFEFFFEKPLCVLTPVTAVVCWAVEWYGIMMLQVLLALAELMIAFFLHGHRKSETTMAVAFPKSRYPFQYIVMLIAALLVDAFVIYSILYMTGESEYDFFRSNDFYLFILITLIVIIVSFVFLNIVLEKNGRAAFSKIRHFFIFTLCYGLVLFTIFNWIAPNIPYQILPFKPEYAVICVNTVTIKKEDYDINEIVANEYYGYDEEWAYNAAEAAQKGGDYYSVSVSNVVREAYCISDKEKLNKLLNMIQRNQDRNSNDFCVSEYSHPTPIIYNEEELYSVKMYTVYFMKDNMPYIQEGMSIYNFSSLADYSRCSEFYCAAKLDTIMEEFKETKLDPMGFTSRGSRSFTVYIPDSECNSPNQNPEITWHESMPSMPESSQYENHPVTSEGFGFENPPVTSETAFFENPPVISQTTPPVR